MSKAYRPTTALEDSQMDFAEMKALCKDSPEDMLWIEENGDKINPILTHDAHTEKAYGKHVRPYSPDNMKMQFPPTKPTSFKSISHVDDDYRWYDCTEYLPPGADPFSGRFYLPYEIICAIDLLPKDKKEVLIRHNLLGETSPAIAKRMGYTPSNVLKTNSRAISLVRKTLHILDNRGSDTLENAIFVVLLLAAVLAVHYFSKQYLLPRFSWLGYIGYAGLAFAAILCGLLSRRKEVKEIEEILRQSRNYPQSPCESVSTEPAAEDSTET